MQNFNILTSSSVPQTCRNAQVVEVIDETYLPPYQKKKAHCKKNQFLRNLTKLFNLNTASLIACLMVIAWILFASVGILTARF